MLESINVRGDVNVTITHLESGDQEVREYRNLVMQVGKTILARRLANDGAYINSFVNRISFGTLATATVDSQTNLLGTIVSPAAAIAIAYPAYNSVRFSATMLGTEGGSNTYQEIGLFASDGKMFSRLVIAPVTKSTAYQISVDWTISFQ